MRKNDWLEDFKRNIKSQHGEDGIIEKIFEIIPNKNNWCVEFGVWDGQILSNTWNLINNLGWSGVLIECENCRFNELLKYYKENPKVICLNRFVNFNGVNTLDNILNGTNIPPDFDLLSIDIDGNDYHIWDSIKQYRPKLVVIEYNPNIPNDIIYIQERNFNVFQGSSLASFVQIAKEKRYELIATTRNNAFFLDKEYFPLMEISDNSLFYLRKYDPEVESRIFTLFDGTVILQGRIEHSETGYKIPINKIQFLPHILRKYIGKEGKPIIIKILYFIHRILFK
jgi:hypothetical protein